MMMESFTGRFEGFARNSRAKRVYHETHQKHENIPSRHRSKKSFSFSSGMA
jgi:hypothetical protein